jgi:hypothetical protein
MKKPDPIIIGIIIFALVIFGGIILATVLSAPPPIAQYKPTDQDRPKLEIGQTLFDFGSMKLTDVKSQDVPLKNTGTKPLIISDILTSCDCTFAQLIVADKTSPRFSMQRNPDWRGEILPGKGGVIKITYEPKIMPVKGGVKRNIVFKTNDPNQPSINLSFNAIVE